MAYNKLLPRRTSAEGKKRDLICIIYLVKGTTTHKKGQETTIKLDIKHNNASSPHLHKTEPGKKSWRCRSSCGRRMAADRWPSAISIFDPFPAEIFAKPPRCEVSKLKFHERETHSNISCRGEGAINAN